MTYLEYLGWIATALVLIGFWANSKNKRFLAFITWIIGDACWVIYDVYITNWSHLVLSFIIIAFNLYGIYNNFKHDNKGISETHK